METAPLLHTAGPMSPKALNAIYRHIGPREINLSLETGAGASTLLMSHLSNRHLVFAYDGGSRSIDSVRNSPLLNRTAVEFIEGPTQKTLPRFTFPGPVQFALIDGPHAYPFPDLEYYYIYQALEEGALLVLDDIHIKTVNHLFSFLKKDDMFSLAEVVGTTAFFTRTDAPTFCASADGWELQSYNKRVLHQYDWNRQVRELLPTSIRRFLKAAIRACQSDCRIWIDRPERRAYVSNTGVVSGRAAGNLRDRFLWVLVRREGQDGWWPQGGGPIPVNQGSWQCVAEFGGCNYGSNWFEIVAILANSSVNDFLVRTRSAEIHDFPFRSASAADAYRRVQRK
jgi:hypothetical protein